MADWNGHLDSLHFLSVADMRSAVGVGGACDACFTGKYPLEIDW